MSPRGKPMPAPAAAPLRQPAASGGYASLSIGLVMLACEDAGGAAAWDGLHALLDHLFREGIPCVAVSVAPRAELAELLARQGCDCRLPMRVGREDLPADPSWAVALQLACSRLAVVPRHTVAIADGDRALAGGAAIGCSVVRYARAACGGGASPRAIDRLERAIPIAAWSRLD